MEEQALPTGAILDKKYLIVSPIAEGAMGWVYQAEHLVLLHPVALKVLRPSCAKSEAVRARLRREAQILARLRSPHTVRITDASFPQDDRQYIAMEYVSGQELASYIAERLPIPAPMAIEIVAQVCHSLSEAHQLDIVHRDVKPENILLESIEPILKVRLIDFGVAKELDLKASLSHTMREGKLGTPGYMAPEQLLDPGSVDARADVFSVGVLLFELLSGSLPFREDAEEIGLAAWLNPLRLDALNPAVDPGIVRIVERCLSVDPRDRYPSALELKADLDRFVEPKDADPLRESEPPEVTFEVPFTPEPPFPPPRSETEPPNEAFPPNLGSSNDQFEAAAYPAMMTPVLSPRPRRSPGILAAAVTFSAIFSFGAAYGAGLGDLLVDNVIAPPRLSPEATSSMDSMEAVATSERTIAAHTLSWPQGPGERKTLRVLPEPSERKEAEQPPSPTVVLPAQVKRAAAGGSESDEGATGKVGASRDFELSDPWSAKDDTETQDPAESEAGAAGDLDREATWSDSHLPSSQAEEGSSEPIEANSSSEEVSVEGD